MLYFLIYLNLINSIQFFPKGILYNDFSYNNYFPQTLGWEGDTNVTFDSINLNNYEGDFCNHITSSPNNKIYFVWYRYKSSFPQYYYIQFRSYDPITRTFSACSLVSDENTRNNYYPSIASDSNGNLHFVWRGYRTISPTGNKPFYRKRIFGYGFTSLETIPGGWLYKYYPKVACGKGDTAHIVYYALFGNNKNNIIYVRKGNEGWHSKIDTITYWNYHSEYPDIAVDKNNRVYITWSGYSPTSETIQQIYFRFRNENGEWSNIESVTTINSIARFGNFHPQIAVENNGTIHIVWYGDNGRGYLQIFYRRKTRNGWDSILQLTSGFINNYSPKIAVDGINNVHIVWLKEIERNSQLLYIKRNADGSWSNIQELTNGLFFRQAPAITVSNDLNIHISWVDTRRGYYNIYYKRFFAPRYDIGIVNILNPNGPTSRTAKIPQVLIKNYGLNTAYNFQLRLEIQPGNYFDVKTVDSLLPERETIINFSSWMPNESVWFRVKCTTHFVLDEDSINNSKKTMVAIYDYYENFESSNGGFLNILPSDWEYGEFGISGDTYCWSTNGYSNYSNSRLNSCRYYALIDSPVVVYWHKYDIEYFYDGYNVKCSIPNSNWQIIHSLSNLGQRYTTVASPFAVGVANESVYCGSSDWQMNWMKIPVSQGNFFYLRFHFGSDPSINYFGPRIDKIYGIGFSDRLLWDIGVKDIISPKGMIEEGEYVPKVIIKNFGLNTANNISVTMKIGDNYLDSLRILSLSPNDEETINFSSLNLISGVYSISCSTYFTFDQNLENNIKNSYCGVYNYFENFERNCGGFSPYPRENAWEWGKPNAGPLNGVDGDTMVWATKLNSNYSNNADWKLTSFPFLIIRPFPIFAYWHWYESEENQDGYNVKYSSDGGITWHIAHAMESYGQRYDGIIGGSNVGIPYESAYSKIDRNWKLNFVVIPVETGNVIIRFHFGSDYTQNYYGVAIDKVYGLGLKPAKDVGVTEILEPKEEVPVDSFVTPKIKVKNFGAFAENFYSYFKIFFSGNLIYTESIYLRLAPNKDTLLIFPNYQVREIGEYLSIALVKLNNDQNPNNDTFKQSFSGVYYDLATVGIIQPTGNLPPLPVTPKVIIKNYSNKSCQFIQIFNIAFQNSFIYSDTLNYIILPNEEETLSFASFVPQDTGNFYCISFLKFEKDRNARNDTAYADFNIGYFDFGITKIISPKGVIFYNPFYPQMVKAKIKNYNNFPFNITTIFNIFKNDTIFFSDTQITMVNPQEEREVIYESFYCLDTGKYITNCKLLNKDLNPFNDSLIDSFKVVIKLPGWYRLKDVIKEISNKNIKDGGALLCMGDSLYALRGNNTLDLLVYSIIEDEWYFKDTVPYGEKKKKVKNGSAFTSDGNKWIYLLKGNNTREFYKYGVKGDSTGIWISLPEIPSSKKIKKGASLVFYKGKIYCLPGGNRLEFYVYDPIINSWSENIGAPSGKTGKGFGEGSALTTDNKYIYALKGGAKVNEFFKYHPDSGWQQLPDLPLYSKGKKKKVKKGGSIVYANEYIYALKGGNTLDFWRFELKRDSWLQLEDLPLGSGKKVKGGGSLAWWRDRIFAIKGNNSREFYMYLPSESYQLQKIVGNQEEKIVKKEFDLLIKRNPADKKIIEIYFSKMPAQISLYTPLGNRCLFTTNNSGYFLIDSKKLNKGVYILKLKTKKFEIKRKIIVI